MVTKRAKTFLIFEVKIASAITEIVMLYIVSNGTTALEICATNMQHTALDCTMTTATIEKKRMTQKNVSMTATVIKVPEYTLRYFVSPNLSRSFSRAI